MACHHGSPIEEMCPACTAQTALAHNGVTPQAEDTLARDLDAPFIAYGWVCPKCGASFAPHVTGCRNCTGLPELT